MAGSRGTYADGPQPYHGGDPNRDIATILTALDRIVSDLYGGQNVVLSGFALSIVSGMQLQVGAGVCYANGVYAVTSAQTLNLNPTTTNPRYTILRVTVTPNNPNGTDPSTGNNLIADTNAVDFLDGTAESSPAKPALGSSYQVQVGSVLLPANTTALTSSMLNAIDCAPNNLYDPSPLTNALTHRQASLGTATVHGYQATAPGATGQGKLLVGDTTTGAAGAALGVVDGAGITHPAAQSGQHPLGYLAVYDTSTGRVEDSKLLAGLGPSGFDAAGAAGAVQTALNSHEGQSPKTAAGVHNLILDCGSVGAQTVSNQGYYDFTVPLNYQQPDANYRARADWVVASPFTVGYGGTTQIFNKQTTSFQVRVTQNSGASQSIGLDWQIVR